MQKLVLKLDIHDDADCKRKAMNLVSSIPGIESISMNIKAKELTIIGSMDPVNVAKKLRKYYNANIVSVGPAKEPEKPKEEPKKPKEEPKKPEPVIQAIDYIHAMEAYNAYNNRYNNPFYYRYHYN